VNQAEHEFHPQSSSLTAFFVNNGWIASVACIVTFCIIQLKASATYKSRSAQE